MKLDTQRILYAITKPILKRNKRFIGRHQGETCYIFGNGASLKYMDLSSFSNLPTIGLNFLCLHNGFRSLDVQYYATIEPFFFYPFVKNPYTHTYQTNVLGSLFKKALRSYPEVKLFTSISNIFGVRRRNTYYLHHYGIKTPAREHLSICGEFSFMKGALYAGIGLAANLGFRKGILVGCDYIFTPCSDGHFYSAGPPARSNRFENVFKHLFNESRDLIELSVIVDNGESRWLPYQSYESFTGKKLEYKENIEIVSREYLDMLNLAYKQKCYLSAIYPENESCD